MTIEEILTASIKQSEATLEESRMAIRKNVELGTRMIREESRRWNYGFENNSNEEDETI